MTPNTDTTGLPDPTMNHEDELLGDVLNARRFLHEHGTDVRYVPVLGRWLVWTGSHWTADEVEHVSLLAQHTIDNLRAWVADGPLDEMRRRAAHLAASSTATRIRAMVEVARPNVAIRVEDLDRNPDLLACPNGTLNLRTGVLRPADRDDLITRAVPVEYDEDAHSDEFLAFLDRTFGSDVELVDYVQRLCGYGLTGHTSEHVIGIWWGTGGNGKSALVEAIRSSIGPYSASAAEGLLTAQSDRHEERIASLRGIRLLISSELEKRVRLAEALVKVLTGGDRLTGRHMYRDRFEFVPELTVVLLTNYQPRVDGRDEGIWRRVKLVPFTNTVPADERILNYGQKLADEHGPAILAWLVEGARSWYEHGLGTCEAVEVATANYRQAEDRIARFVTDTCLLDDSYTVPVTMLYAAWRTWCEDRAEGRPGRQQDFQTAIEGVGFEVVEMGKRDRRFAGLNLVECVAGR
jgi:putative DNA primase/helicase